MHSSLLYFTQLLLQHHTTHSVSALCQEHQVVLTHGNGPQVGELALERSAATFDVLGAESVGQIGYVLAQALASVGTMAVPIITQVVVDPTDPAFRNPTKFVGPVYGPKEAHALAESLGWVVKPDGEYFRRVVPSPPPLEILQLEAIRSLLENNNQRWLPIACGGGGVPVSRVPSRPQTLQGVEAVIDKDHCGSKLAVDLEADGFIILTDGGGIWKNFGKPDAKEMQAVTPEYLLGTKAGAKFPGSMGPKIEAALKFVADSTNPNAWAAIGDLRDAAKIISKEEGTLIQKKLDNNESVIWRERPEDPEAAKRPPKLSQDPPKYG